MEFEIDFADPEKPKVQSTKSDHKWGKWTLIPAYIVVMVIMLLFVSLALWGIIEIWASIMGLVNW